MTTTIAKEFSKKLETLRSQWRDPRLADPVQDSSPCIRFNRERSRVFTPEECRDLQDEILMHIFTHTPYGLEQSPEVRRRNSKLLGYYVELYLWDPARYPADPGNPIHCLINQAGRAVMAKYQNKVSSVDTLSQRARV